MTASESQSGRDPPVEGILTLPEAAAYLRVKAEAVEQLVADQAIPARQIGGEWRFSRKALDDWLRFAGRHHRDYWREYPPWMLDSPFTEELIHLLEERLLHKLRQSAPSRPRPGSKHAVLEHFGIFRNDDDLEERLADARKRREEPG